MQSVNNSFDFYSVLSIHILLRTRSMHYSSLPLHFYLACSSIFSSRHFCTLQLSLVSKTGCIEVRLGRNTRLVGPKTVYSSARQVTLQCKTSFGITVQCNCPVKPSRSQAAHWHASKHGIHLYVTSDQHHLISQPSVLQLHQPWKRVCVVASVFRIPPHAAQYAQVHALVCPLIGHGPQTKI